MFVCLSVAVAAVTAVTVPLQQQHNDNVDNGGLVDRVLDRCSMGPGAVNCLKTNVLEYLDGRRAGRAAGDGPSDLDSELVRAAGEYMESRAFYGPESARADAGASATASASMDVAQPQQPTTTTTARGLDILNIIEFLKVVKSLIKFSQSLTKLKQSELNLAFIPFVADMEMGMMQDKMLMPLMMMMKMKLKMLMPIMMALVSMKATKALILSKVAIMLVLGFIVKEFLKKSGGIPGLPLHLPGMPSAAEPPSSTAGTPMYGPPQSSGYDSSSSWEPTGYSSHSSADSAHSLAYSSYQPSSSSGSSASLSATKY